MALRRGVLVRGLERERQIGRTLALREKQRREASLRIVSPGDRGAGAWKALMAIGALERCRDRRRTLPSPDSGVRRVTITGRHAQLGPKLSAESHTDQEKG